MPYNSTSYDDLTTLLNYYNNYPYPVPLAALVMNSYVQHKVVDCGNIDLTGFIADAKASYGDTEVTGFEILKVNFGGTEYTDGFSSFDMSVPGCYNVTYGISYEGKSIEANFTVVAMSNHNSVANGGFESGNLAGWTVLNDKWSYVDGHAAGVISAENYWGEALPYNQAGNYHLDGWNNGIEEGDTWAVRSTNFTLSGSGFISLRMGGHAAAVRVYKVDGWAHAFFDEVVTYYEQAPDYSNNADTVPDGGTGEEVTIPWQLLE